jgi:hypothetical protein
VDGRIEQRAARELGYDFGRLRAGRDPAHRLPAAPQHNTLSSSPFYSPVLQGAEQACRRAGVALSFYVVNPAEPVAELMRAQQPDAILCAGYFEPELVAVLRDSGKPLALVDMHLPGFSSVNPDHHLGGYLATRHLIRTGRRRIAMIAGSLAHYSIHQRARGYRKALFEARMLADPELEKSTCRPAPTGRPACARRPAAAGPESAARRHVLLQRQHGAGGHAGLPGRRPEGPGRHRHRRLRRHQRRRPGDPAAVQHRDRQGSAGRGRGRAAARTARRTAEHTLPVQLIVRESSYDD